MKIYNTKTQADYDALMIYLEEKGCKWFYGEKPTGINLWFMYKETTCLRVDNYVIIHSSLDYYKEKYPNEKIDEYLETLKPKFKVGDYVTVDVNDRTIIAKIDELRVNDIEVHGLWYDRTLVNVKQDYWFSSELNKFRHATDREIAEYKVALTFLKHDRNPFEVKRGDVVYLKGYDKNIFLDSGNIYKKHNFIDGDVGLVKTVEEVNEWLENK